MNNEPIDVLAVMAAEIADMAGISCIGDEHEAAQRAREASMRAARTAVAELIAERDRLRELAAASYAGLVAECDLPEAWADAFLAASQGDHFSADGLLPFTSTQRAALAELAEASDIARQFLRSERWGTIDYMEGSEVYADLRSCAETIDAALALVSPLNKDLP